MNSLPPTPRSLQTPPSLTTLLVLMSKAKRADEDVHNVAKTLFKPDTKIMFKRSGKAHLARVLDVTGVPGRTFISIEKISSMKRFNIRLEDIIGIVQEN